MPGVYKSDLDISFNDGNMIIKAIRKEVHEESSDTVHRVERHFGKVSRTLSIPRNADQSNAVATLKDGVLNIVFPKTQTKPSQKLLIA